MYKLIVRPLFFLFNAEWVHYFALNTLKLIGKIPFGSTLVKSIYCKNLPSLEKEVFGLKFKNPVGLAAGFDKNGKYINELADFGFSFIEIGTVTPKPQDGNPKKRLFRLVKDNAIINRLGINNDGVKVIAERIKKTNTNVIIGGNIGKNTATSNDSAADDYLENFKTLHPHVDYFALNVSCPNVNNFTKLQDVEFLKKLILFLYNKSKNLPILHFLLPKSFSISIRL